VIEQQLNLIWDVGSVFTPSAPIDDSALFAGRESQLAKIGGAVSQRGQHVVIYGERGVGKTSLANVLFDLLKKRPERFQIARINCEEKTTFSSLWHSVFRALSVTQETSSAGFKSNNTNEEVPASVYLPIDVKPDDVRYMFQQIGKQTVVIIDELDRIEDEETTTRLADTIKTLSDNSTSTTLVLVGVGDSVDDLIKEHKSVERALVQILMPRMSKDEIIEIVNKGLNRLNMSIDLNAKNKIVQLSRELPHYTHLLCKHAAQEALIEGRKSIALQDVLNALEVALEQAQQSIVRTYHTATSSPRGNLYTEVLLACALAPRDELGYFSSAGVRPHLSRIMHKKYEIPAFARHLNDFNSEERGAVLERTGYPRRYKFRFRNPLMEPYVIMNGLKKSLITEGDLEMAVA